MQRSKTAYAKVFILLFKEIINIHLVTDHHDCRHLR